MKAISYPSSITPSITVGVTLDARPITGVNVIPLVGGIVPLEQGGVINQLTGSVPPNIWVLDRYKADVEHQIGYQLSLKEVVDLYTIGNVEFSVTDSFGYEQGYMIVTAKLARAWVTENLFEDDGLGYFDNRWLLERFPTLSNAILTSLDSDDAAAAKHEYVKSIVDRKEFIEEYIESDGYTNLAHYDGEVKGFMVQGVSYITYRID